MDKKKTFIVLGCIFIFVFVFGITYAYWNISFEQKQENVVKMDCFKIEFIEGNAINLTKTYPISDEDGMKNNPYTFTIKNICEGRASYQINLETLIPNGKKLPDEYLKVNLVENNISKITTKLESSLSTETTIDEAVFSYKLLEGVIRENESKTFDLRIWMHGDVTASDKESMNAIYNGKISIINSYLEPLPVLADTIKSIPIVTSGNGLYKVEHSDASITYTSDTTAINNLKQTELRYAGPNPNNYVKFNNELWRIIGLVNTPEGQRIKIIRNESIGNYSWDSSPWPNNMINGGYGVNEWSQSKMMNLLNDGAYYNRTSGTCYNGRSNASVSCDFSNSGLMNESKEILDTVTWNTGGNGKTSYDNISVISSYNLERSSNTGKTGSGSAGCNDSVTRTTSWKGKVGLMYPSDYGYATSGGSTINRSTCLGRALYMWDLSNDEDCKTNNWMYKSGVNQWMITPNAYSRSEASYVLSLYSDGRVLNMLASNAYAIFPSLYLKSNVKIEKGNGSNNNPFELSI